MYQIIMRIMYISLGEVGEWEEKKQRMLLFSGHASHGTELVKALSLGVQNKTISKYDGDKRESGQCAGKGVQISMDLEWKRWSEGLI